MNAPARRKRQRARLESPATIPNPARRRVSRLAPQTHSRPSARRTALCTLPYDPLPSGCTISKSRTLEAPPLAAAAGGAAGSAPGRARWAIVVVVARKVRACRRDTGHAASTRLRGGNGAERHEPRRTGGPAAPPWGVLRAGWAAVAPTNSYGSPDASTVLIFRRSESQPSARPPAALSMSAVRAMLRAATPIVRLAAVRPAVALRAFAADAGATASQVQVRKAERRSCGVLGHGARLGGLRTSERVVTVSCDGHQLAWDGCAVRLHLPRRDGSGQAVATLVCCCCHTNAHVWQGAPRRTQLAASGDVRC